MTWAESVIRAARAATSATAGARPRVARFPVPGDRRRDRGLQVAAGQDQGGPLGREQPADRVEHGVAERGRPQRGDAQRFRHGPQAGQGPFEVPAGPAPLRVVTSFRGADASQLLQARVVDVSQGGLPGGQADGAGVVLGDRPRVRDDVGVVQRVRGRSDRAAAAGRRFRAGCRAGWPCRPAPGPSPSRRRRPRPGSSGRCPRPWPRPRRPAGRWPRGALNSITCGSMIALSSPCGRSVRPPIWWEMAWVAPSSALVKARPACRLARASPSRARRSPGWSRAGNRCSVTPRMAARAWTSVRKLAAFDT